MEHEPEWSREQQAREDHEGPCAKLIRDGERIRDGEYECPSGTVMETLNQTKESVQEIRSDVTGIRSDVAEIRRLIKGDPDYGIEGLVPALKRHESQLIPMVTAHNQMKAGIYFVFKAATLVGIVIAGIIKAWEFLAKHFKWNN